MPSPNAIFTELVTTTHRRHKKEVADAFSNNNALLSYLKKKGKITTTSGGTSLVCPLEYAQNGTYTRYSGFDPFDISASNILTSAEYPWRQAAVSVVSSGLELRNNMGPEQIIKLATTKLKNAIKTANNNFSFDLYSDGTLPNQIGGLQLLISDSGLGTVGGIDSSVHPFWQNKVQSAATPLGGGGAVVISSTTIEQLMLDLWLEMVIGADHPDLILFDNKFFAMYEQSQVSFKRYTDAKEADGGFMTLMYKGSKVMHDGGSGIPLNRGYFLNTDYIEVTAHKDANWTVLDEVRSQNQDGTAIPIIFQGNMTLANRQRQGIFRP